MEHLIEQELDFKCNMNKELLIKDLCPRLPYGLVIDFNGIRMTLHDMKVFQLYDGDVIKDYICLINVFGDDDYIDIEENIKPYLFPMSSMTEEQKEELQSLIIQYAFGKSDNTFTLQDFYCKYHLDYRGLISKGLANNATGLNIY